MQQFYLITRNLAARRASPSCKELGEMFKSAVFRRDGKLLSSSFLQETLARIWIRQQPPWGDDCDILYFLPTWTNGKVTAINWYRPLWKHVCITVTGLVFTVFIVVVGCVFPPQDHFLVLASLLVLQRVPAVSGLCSPAEAAAAAAAGHHVCHPPLGVLPEASVGSTARTRGPIQHVSRLIYQLMEMKHLENSAQAWSAGHVTLESHREAASNSQFEISVIIIVRRLKKRLILVVDVCHQQGSTVFPQLIDFNSFFYVIWFFCIPFLGFWK